MVEMTATDVVEKYSQALAGRDFAAARSLLADDLRFEGPIDQFDRADAYMKASSGLCGMVKGGEPRGTIARGEAVAVFYLLAPPMAKAPGAGWYAVRGGRVVRRRAYSDARPSAPPQPDL